jgi:hypothetical protein
MVAFDEFIKSVRLSIAGYFQLCAAQAFDFAPSLSNILCGGCGIPNPKIKASPVTEEQASVRRIHLPQDLGTTVGSNLEQNQSERAPARSVRGGFFLRKKPLDVVLPG